MGWSYVSTVSRGVVSEELQQRRVVLGGGGLNYGRQCFCVRQMLMGQKKFSGTKPYRQPMC